jgi:hypothetical protein
MLIVLAELEDKVNDEEEAFAVVALVGEEVSAADAFVEEEVYAVAVVVVGASVMVEAFAVVDAYAVVEVCTAVAFEEVEVHVVEGVEMAYIRHCHLEHNQEDIDILLVVEVSQQYFAKKK